LKAASGATTYGGLADHPQGQDPTFAPDVALHGGERLEFGAASCCTRSTRPATR